MPSINHSEPIDLVTYIGEAYFSKTWIMIAKKLRSAQKNERCNAFNSLWIRVKKGR